MPRLLLATAALLILAACDSTAPPTPLDGAWVARDSVTIFTGGAPQRGTLTSEYTFAVDGTRISGMLRQTARDRQEAVLNVITSRITGTYTTPVFSITLTEDASSIASPLRGTTSATVVELFRDLGDGIRLPYATLVRP